MKTGFPATLALALLMTLASGCASNGMEDSAATDAARTNTQLAAAYLERGNFDVAMEKIDRALEQDDGFARAHLVKGMILARAEEFDDADDYYRRAARLGEEDAAVLNNVAAYHCQRGRAEDGEEMFLEVARMPTFSRPAIALTNAGMCARKIPEPRRAERHFRRALELEPAYPAALWHMAELSLLQDEGLAARGFLQRLEGVRRLGPGALYLGFRIEKALGDQDAASRYADILLRDFPGSREAQQMVESRASDQHKG